MDDRDLLRHLTEGGPQLYERPEPPKLDLDAITGGPASSPFAAPQHAPEAKSARSARGGGWTGLSAADRRRRCHGLRRVRRRGRAVLFGGETGSPAQVAASTPTTPPAPTGRQVFAHALRRCRPDRRRREVNVFTATNGRTVDLRVKGLPQPKKGEFYELWVLGDAARCCRWASCGSTSSGSAEVRMPLPVSLRRFPVFDISLESGDGNPTHSGHSVPPLGRRSLASASTRAHWYSPRGGAR